MTVNKFIRNLLNLKELFVTHFELHARKRTIPMAALIVITFSFLFNSVIMNKYF